MIKNYYDQKTILITGAASGIGKRFAEKVSEIAETTLILWDRNPDILDEMKAANVTQSRIITAGIDISDPERIYLESEKLFKQNLLPDIIINCAGVVTGKLFHEHSVDEIDLTIRINATGSMLVTQAFLKKMIDRGSGHIVNLASASGYTGIPRLSVYASSKWAVLGWSESLRIEMEMLKTGISVTAVIPSYIDTGMFDGVKAPLMVPILKTDDIVNRMLKGITRQKKEIRAPFIVNFVPLLKATLPTKIFDWLSGNVTGAYKSMDSFIGREPKSS
ncbi:MAG: SDR family NAD(P)-dependent oxidoreductase [Balneolaceae bacterium]|nr:MAG: SDR family NAD(P)-dependent oxidoreductase [Balneolaceae bacterium]